MHRIALVIIRRARLFPLFVCLIFIWFRMDETFISSLNSSLWLSLFRWQNSPWGMLRVARWEFFHCSIDNCWFNLTENIFSFFPFEVQKQLDLNSVLLDFHHHLERTECDYHHLSHSYHCCHPCVLIPLIEFWCKIIINIMILEHIISTMNEMNLDQNKRESLVEEKEGRNHFVLEQACFIDTINFLHHHIDHCPCLTFIWQCFWIQFFYTIRHYCSIRNWKKIVDNQNDCKEIEQC